MEYTTITVPNAMMDIFGNKANAYNAIIHG